VNSEDVSSILEKLNIDKSSISPDMINGFMNMLGNQKETEVVEDSTPDYSNSINSSSNSSPRY